MAELTASASARYPDDVTACSLCTGTLKDPRQLPCIHTFCLNCIEEWAEKTKRHTGDAEKLTKLECPMCGKNTEVPDGGLVQLPRNIFTQQLLEAKVISSALAQTEIKCDVCSNEVETGVGTQDLSSRKSSSLGNDGKISATVYCMQCRKNMCDNCHRFHERFGFDKSHSVIESNGNEQREREVLSQLPDSKCEIHEEPIKIYCADCKVVVCTMCYIKSHKLHECSDVKEVAGDLAMKMSGDGKDTDKKVTECEKLLEKIAEDEKKFLERVDETEKEILNKCEDMKKMIEEYKSKLIAELDETKLRQLKQNEDVRRELEDRVKMLRHFSKYVEELSGKGKACVVAHSTIGIQTRAKELLEFDVYEDLESERTSVEITFGSLQPIDNVLRVFGDLKLEFTNEVNFTRPLQPINVMLSSPLYKFSGIALLGTELFVMRYGASEIDVYDITTSAQLRTISASFLSYKVNRGTLYQSRGLVACPVNKCLYISDVNKHQIHKVDVAGKAAATKWQVGNCPHGLSLNAAHNVLVACNGDKTIHEYTTEGTLVRQITLQSDVTNPVHVVQLSNNQFGIIHQNPYSYHRYCVVGIDGQVVKSYGNKAGSGEGELNKPFGLAVNRYGSVFIADQDNNRVVVIHPTSFTAKSLPANLGLKAPYCLHLDETHHRLYIAEWEGRVVVLQNSRETNAAA